MKLRSITPDQRKLISSGTGISVDQLRHQQTGRRTVSARDAQRIERAAEAIGLDITRESMCDACRKCDLAKKARRS